MTQQEILKYLFNEEVSHSNGFKITSVTLKNKETKLEETHLVYFLKSNQKENLANENQWVLLPVDNVLGFFIADGEDIIRLS